MAYTVVGVKVFSSLFVLANSAKNHLAWEMKEFNSFPKFAITIDTPSFSYYLISLMPRPLFFHSLVSFCRSSPEIVCGSALLFQSSSGKCIWHLQCKDYINVLAVLSVATVASQFYFAASTLCRFLWFVQYLHPFPTLRCQIFGHSGSQGHHL